MTAPVDMKQLRETIAQAVEGGPAAYVGRDWLERVEAELLAGRAAAAELARMKGTPAVIDSIAGSAR